jgi:hypothetical protein
MDVRTCRRAASFGLLGVFVLAVVAHPGEPVPGPEFQVNTYTPGIQGSASMASDDAGNFVVVWNSKEQDGSGYGIFGRLYDAAGEPLGGEFSINTHTTGYQRGPSVASDNAGNFVVVWSSLGQDGSAWGVFGQRFDAAANPLGSEFQVNSYTTSFQENPWVSSDPAGNFVVVWPSSEQDGSGEGVFAQRFTASGEPSGAEFQVNVHTTACQDDPRVSSAANGDFVVVWSSDFQDGSAEGVFGRRYNASGWPLGGEFQVNTFTTGGQLFPSVDTDDAGDFVIAWTHDYISNDGMSDVIGQRFDAAGNPLGGEFQINSYSTGHQSFANVASDRGGNFTVMWMSEDQDGSDFGVFGQQYDSSAAPTGSQFQINSYTTDAQFPASLHLNDDGSFVAIWTSRGQDGSEQGVFGRRFLSHRIFADGFESGDTSAWSIAVP